MSRAARQPQPVLPSGHSYQPPPSPMSSTCSPPTLCNPGPRRSSAPACHHMCKQTQLRHTRFRHMVTFVAILANRGQRRMMKTYASEWE